MQTPNIETRDGLKKALQQRIAEFGIKPSYLLFEEELEAGLAFDIFEATEEPVDKGDGTSIWKVTFEGRAFQCVLENEK